MNNDLLRQFVKERDEAVLTFDVPTFRRFYKRWADKGVYDRRLLPPDNVVEISLRQMVIGMANPPKDKLEEAKAWLRARGYDEEPFK